VLAGREQEVAVQQRVRLFEKAADFGGLHEVSLVASRVSGRVVTSAAVASCGGVGGGPSAAGSATCCRRAACSAARDGRATPAARPAGAHRAPVGNPNSRVLRAGATRRGRNVRRCTRRGGPADDGVNLLMPAPSRRTSRRQSAAGARRGRRPCPPRG
jgi:hypothetical protein